MRLKQVLAVTGKRFLNRCPLQWGFRDLYLMPCSSTCSLQGFRQAL